MSENTLAIIELRAVIEEQQELLRLILWVMSQGPIVFQGQKLKSVLEWDQVRAVSATSLGAGQSLNTILKGSSAIGIPIRDLYPIARGVIEGFINAAFFVTQPVEVSQRALKHKDYAAWKHMNRVIGTGEFAFTLSTSPDSKALAALMFPEFAGKGQGSWSMLDAPSKIDRIGKVVRSAGGALLGAYGLIYAISSEIIHGSVYGMSYFMSAHNPGEMNVEGFLANTESQVVDILSAVSHAASGFLAAFAQISNCQPLIDVERTLFERLYKAAQSEDFGRDSSSSAKEQD
ncbi:EcsC family protein [Pseudomonas brassicacearum]|uniref:DUF5677 domain-containing protein n=1 Tax=Pseudomonas brassicacearum TaxID=930166 RepID=UPI0039E703C0